MTTLPARPEKAARKDRAPPSRARSPVKGSVTVRNSPMIWLSALVRSCIAEVIALPASAKESWVGAPALEPVSANRTPGMAFSTTLPLATTVRPSILTWASVALTLRRVASPAGFQARAASPGSAGSSVASSTKPLAAPSAPSTAISAEGQA